ncbi:MAG: VWA domain-containing protein [Planctomycetota bacterium]|nr:VWA domain-containing protein [Planctomycetota bacterium]
MRACLAVPVCLLLAAPVWAATPAAAKLKDQVKEASAQDNAQGVGGVLGLLNQALAKAAEQRNNDNGLREYEEIVNDCQDAVAQMRSPESDKAFTVNLARLAPNAQAQVLFGLIPHDSNSDLDEAATKVLASTRDISVMVACMDLLGAHKYDGAVDAIVKQLKPTQAVCVQVAACRALARIPDKKAVAPLVEYLRQLKGSRMRYEATAALRAITGQDFNPDAATWDGWWKKNEADFKKENAKEPVYNLDLTVDKKEELSYYEIPIVENRIVFLFDTSGSMTLGGKPNRFEKARDQLKDLIMRLDESRALFNIILFSGNVRRWNKQQPLVPANAMTKKAACQFLDEARPGGGTQTMSAMEEALREVAFINGVETIFLITDGAPQPMLHSDVKTVAELPRGNEAIKRRIGWINQVLKVRVHTIGIYTRAAGDPAEQGVESMKAFLEGIAKKNDGVYKEVP